MRSIVTTILCILTIQISFGQNIVEKQDIAYGKTLLKMENQLPKYSLTQYKRVKNGGHEYILQVKDHQANDGEMIEKNSSILLKTGNGEIIRTTTSTESSSYNVFGANEMHYELTITLDVSEDIMEKIALSGLSKIRYYQKKKKNDIDILESKRDNIERIAGKLLDTQLIKEDIILPISSD